MEARGLLLGGRGGLEGFGIRGEILAAVRGVEAFGEDDQRGAGFGGFEDAGAGTSEVGSLVGAWGGGGSQSRRMWWLGEGDVPVASCTRASFKGFLRRRAIFC